MPFEISPKIEISDADAIRLGCKIARQQCFGRLFDFGEDGQLQACAAGAWLLGRGLPIEEAHLCANDLDVCDKTIRSRKGFDLFCRVWRLNDGVGARASHPREEIANMIERGEI